MSSASPRIIAILRVGKILFLCLSYRIINKVSSSWVLKVFWVTCDKR